MYSSMCVSPHCVFVCVSVARRVSSRFPKYSVDDRALALPLPHGIGKSLDLSIFSALQSYLVNHQVNVLHFKWRLQHRLLTQRLKLHFRLCARRCRRCTFRRSTRSILRRTGTVGCGPSRIKCPLGRSLPSILPSPAPLRPFLLQALKRWPATIWRLLWRQHQRCNSAVSWLCALSSTTP